MLQDESNAKRRKIDCVVKLEKVEAEINGSADQSMEDVAAKASSGAEKYDPEDPESESEKDSEVTEQKAIHDLKESKVVLEDIKTEIKLEVKEEVIIEPPKEEKKPPAKSPGGRAPRARRGGRRN